MDKLERTESHGGRQRPPGSSRSSRLHVACAVSIAALTPSACGSTDEDSTQPATSTAASTTVAPVASASKNAEPTGIQAVRVAYEKLLADPAAAPAQADAEYTPSSEDSFSYAIGEFTGDDRPEMLLRAGAHAANPVFVVSTDPNNTVVVARTIVHQGVNELGQDLQIRFSAAHDFIYQLTFDTIGSTTADTAPTSIDADTINVARTGQAEALVKSAAVVSGGVDLCPPPSPQSASRNPSPDMPIHMPIHMGICGWPGPFLWHNPGIGRDWPGVEARAGPGSFRGPDLAGVAPARHAGDRGASVCHWTTPGRGSGPDKSRRRAERLPRPGADQFFYNYVRCFADLSGNVLKKFFSRHYRIIAERRAG